jgi:hypothetical protein
VARRAKGPRRQLFLSNPAVLVYITLGCGGQAGDVTLPASSDNGVNVSPSSALSPPLAVSEPEPEPVAPAPSDAPPSVASGGAGGGTALGSTSPECAPSEEFPRNDFVVMTFENRTGETLYLASTNSHCGAWPAFVEFSQNASAVDLYGGDCVPYCSGVADSGYQSAMAQVAGCAGPTPCPTPFRAIAPGQQIAQFVFPWQDTHHELPSNCARDAGDARIECLTMRNLAPGSYALRATAYRNISCGDVSCDCDPNRSPDWCIHPDGTEQPRGMGVALYADATLELGSPPGAATLAFSE